MEKFITTLSIVIPVFKASFYIEDLLIKINQTKEILKKAGVNLIEVICVCDEPLDNSLLILKNIEKEYDFLEIIELSANLGQHLATSAGIVASSGDWICTLDEDLQHDPLLIIDLFKKTTQFSYDLVYAKSRIGTHRKSLYRDISSKFAKKIISTLTGQNLNIISSFRLIRGNVARTAATSMDKFQYLDNLLFYLTSNKRRSFLIFDFKDNRINKASGYNFQKLVSHFFRTFYSSEIGSKRFFLILFLPILVISILISISLIIIGQSQGVTITNPGWSSLFIMELIIVVILGLIFTLSMKMYSIIALRTLALPPFLILDRSRDSEIFENLKSLK